MQFQGQCGTLFFFLIQLVLSAMAIFSLALVFLQDTGNFPHVSYFYF